MKHRFIAFMLFTLGALVSMSCTQDDGYYAPPPGPYDNASYCEQFASCGTCTPILGCGWCQSGDKGICLPDPDACSRRLPAFTWTWELAYCPGTIDGSVPDAWQGSPVDATTSSEAGHE
jgi:hypothetical protein